MYGYIVSLKKMNTLRGVFPTVPTEALLRVLEVCDQSVALASTWLLENDWQDLMSEEQDEDVEEEEEETRDLVAPTALQPAGSMVVSTGVQIRDEEDMITGAFPFQEEMDDEEENDEEEEEEDEDEEDVYYDSDDERGFRMGGIPPLVKRVKVSTSEGQAGDDSFWVAFDDQVMIKSMIELLNTTLSKLAHNKVVLLCQPARQLNEAEATVKLQSIVAIGEKEDTDEGVIGSGRDATTTGGITLSRLLNNVGSTRNETSKVAGFSKFTAATTEGSAIRKRQRQDATEDSTQQGFFAHFFSVRELDMVWRTVLHAHLFKGRFGEKIEFHTASEGPKRDFDELMHIQSSAGSSRVTSLGFSPLATLKCCLLLPCPAEEEEIFRVGKNVHMLLKVQGNLYYGVGDASGETNTSDDEKMTEERFRQFARYRVKEITSSDGSPRPSKVFVDPYMSYQQPRKTSYSLECLEGDKWTSRFSS
ncbi:hypothetical protein P3T76_002096 [Phytophthora citrophthora]|uniref:CUE domain-containing protein n=1 Tax=Phytophthora citrophthora TaxID=4793 RepID=A0AAD9GYF5_9STRA|nr:hypothetical protein P3T76_002096 [Phytophthora citrophthora]